MNPCVEFVFRYILLYCAIMRILILFFKVGAVLYIRHGVALDTPPGKPKARLCREKRRKAREVTSASLSCLGVQPCCCVSESRLRLFRADHLFGADDGVVLLGGDQAAGESLFL